jgi:hypothetical protein
MSITDGIFYGSTCGNTAAAKLSEPRIELWVAQLAKELQLSAASVLVAD